MEKNARAGETWRLTATKPAGGYVLIRAGHLLAAWHRYREENIELYDLRVWLACHELVARRCQMDRKLRACYRLEELQPLLGAGTLVRLRKSIRNLERAGLLDWQGDQIGLEPITDDIEAAPAGSGAIQEAGKNGRRKVPVPRRTLRFLAGCNRKVMMATVLGHLLRCLYFRGGQCVSGGRCKASWIAEVFGVDARNVKAARQELMATRWLIPVSASQTMLNRWGLPVVVNLIHAFANGGRIHELPPPTVLSTAKSPPPMINKKLSLRDQNQKLGFVRTAGFLKGQARAPDLRNLTVADLRDPRRLDALFRQAVTAGKAMGAPAGRLRWFAAAERALEVSTQNPCGFFVSLFRKNLWHHITNVQEDNARKKLHRLDYGQMTSSKVTDTCSAPMGLNVPDHEAEPEDTIQVIIAKALTKSMAA